MNNRLAIDIGGTFTDVVLERDQKIYATKVLTSHGDPSDAVFEGIAQIFSECSVTANEISIVLHGTTLATNALIERRGAKTALLTTKGHRDIIEMAFENRFEQYDVNIERPDPLVPRRLRLPIGERITAYGDIVLPLDSRSVDLAIDRLIDENVESIAIGFLHSYVDDTHERRVVERVKERLDDVAICRSSEVCPEIREYERLSTTCANAYILPLMNTYLNRMSDRLDKLGLKCPYLMMTSGGGLTRFDTASRFPIRLVESGPAGGAILAEAIANQLEIDKVLSFDMGGTTAKICLIDEGKTLLSRSFEVDRRYRFKKGSGLPIRVPVIEMVEIGAGGGSIAHVDKLGRIQIGPESAGSEPGPACYGRGGTDATVTDSDCVLGKLDAERFAGGQLELQSIEAENAIRTSVAEKLVLDTHEAAQGISEIVDENMAAAARSHASEWGKSLAGRTMVAFGGAAPIHAARMLEKLDLERVVIPEGAGVGSAIGFLSAPISYEVVRSRYMLLSNYDHSLVESVIAEMREEAYAVVLDAVQSVPVDETATAYMRYVGQGHEISVGFAPSDVSQATLQQRFDSTYTDLFGRLIPDADIEVMSWTLNVSTAKNPIRVSTSLLDSERAEMRERTQQLIDRTGVTDTNVVERDSIPNNATLTGPLLVTERHTTTFVPKGLLVRMSPERYLIMEKSTR